MKQTPLDEAIILWRRLAITGSCHKGSTVSYLYNTGKLGQMEYKNHCPLCEAYWDQACWRCPWPGDKNIRCEGLNSPYRKWFYTSHDCPRKTFQKRASVVLGLLKRLKKLKERS